MAFFIDLAAVVVTFWFGVFAISAARLAMERTDRRRERKLQEYDTEERR